jgi:hypothetical protein
VQKEKDRYPLFPEIPKHKSAEERVCSIAIEREHWWRWMRDHHAKQWRRALQAVFHPNQPITLSSLIKGATVSIDAFTASFHCGY